MDKLMKCWFCGLLMLVNSSTFTQMQACPANINFSSGDLTHWFAYTGNNRTGNGISAIKVTYDSLVSAPSGTIGARSIAEYNLPSVAGIRTIPNTGIDPFGGFKTIPNINGYQYNSSILLGSTSVSHASSAGAKGGYVRGISYKINVPSSPSSKPYTMTYAYAMVLENGTHNSNQQPVFSATLTTNDSVITCASPSYYLPTFNNTIEGQTGATLDSAGALRNGFRPSPVASPNPNPNPGPTGNTDHLLDVWTKGWTEVTFDLSPYRGQQVKLTFESDNCIPGGHFAYAYIAIRNNCAGLIISGDSLVCANSNLTYSIPALGGASYEWIIPSSWQLSSDSHNSNIISVLASNQSGLIIVKEQNSCANLQDTILVKTELPGVGGNLSGNATVCEGDNKEDLLLTGNVGQVVKWISSPDGTHWFDIANTTNRYAVSNLNASTLYKVLVQNGTVCSPDSSSSAKISVDLKSHGGNLIPVNNNLCEGQNPGDLLTLTGKRGSVLNWQSSPDGQNWMDFNPQHTDSFYMVNGINTSTGYRLIVKNGVCNPDTSSMANVQYYDVPYPQAFIHPSDTTICFGSLASLDASISVGTSYIWSNSGSLTNTGNGQITTTPFSMLVQAKPLTSTEYILSIMNAGCPNMLIDSFHVIVLSPVIVDAGRDTAIVANEPLQLQANSNDSSGDIFTWLPATGLNNPGIPNPIALLGINTDTIRYTARATTPVGCYGEKSILVRVFKTGPDIFVPNAFTPGKSTNRIFRPIPVGVSSLQYFRIYDRWGRLVFSTSRIGPGWDGTINGKPQDSDSFVWMVQGTDYRGKTIFKKGTMVLIR